MTLQSNKFRVGYIRTGKDESVEKQAEALKEAGCQKLFSDAISERRGFELLKASTRQGDEIVVYSLSRLCRRLDTLLRMTTEFLEAGVSIVSLKEPQFKLDKGLESDAYKWLKFYSDYLDECEEDRRKEKQTKKSGRPMKLSPEERHQIALDIRNHKYTKAEAARRHDVSFTTIAKIAGEFEARWLDKKLDEDKSLETGA